MFFIAVELSFFASCIFMELCWSLLSRVEHVCKNKITNFKTSFEDNFIFIPLSTYSFTHSFIPLLSIISFSSTLIHRSLPHYFVDSFLDFCFHSIIPAFFFSFIHQFIHAFIFSSMHSSIHPCIHLFIH